MVAIWTPPFIGDRLRHNDEHSCIWEPSDNRQFVLFVAVIGHYFPCIIMVTCYFKVFFAMRKQSSKVAATLKNGDTNRAKKSIVDVLSAKEGEKGVRTDGQENDKEAVYQISDQHENRSSNNQYLSTISYISSNKTSNDSDPNSQQPSQASGSRYDTASLAKNNIGKVTQAQNRERKIFVTLTYVLSSYLICWFPFYIAFDTYAWRPELVPAELYTFFFWATYVNSSLNPFIYAYTSREFRSAFVKVLKCLYKCKT